MAIPFEDRRGEPAIHGWLHQAPRAGKGAIALAHGAGSDCNARLLVEMAEALAVIGFTVLRFDLPFRRARPHGPPFPATAARDRDGLRRAASLLREQGHQRVFLGGHSYGGRQASMLAADEPGLADGLLLLSYPLHPPKKPEQLRTQHFPQLCTPAFFVHGTSDPFATSAEMQSALRLIPGKHELLEVQAAGHDLLGKKAGKDLCTRVAETFLRFLAGANANSNASAK